MKHSDTRNLTHTDRVIASVLAVLWLGAGLASLWIAVFHNIWTGFLLGPLAIAYGVIWMRVSYTGEKLTWQFRK